jgi:hypothetical protein
MSRIDDLINGGTNAATNQSLKPLVKSLGSNLNMSQAVAEQVVSFAAQQMVNGHLSGNQQAIDPAGLAHELAKKANIDPKAAADGLKHVLEHFGQQMK